MRRAVHIAAVAALLYVAIPALLYSLVLDVTGRLIYLSTILIQLWLLFLLALTGFALIGTWFRFRPRIAAAINLAVLVALLLYLFAPYPCAWLRETVRPDFADDASSHGDSFSAFVFADDALYAVERRGIFFRQLRRIKNGWSTFVAFVDFAPDNPYTVEDGRVTSYDKGQRLPEDATCRLPDGRILRIDDIAAIRAVDPETGDGTIWFDLCRDDICHAASVCTTADGRIFLSLSSLHTYLYNTKNVGYNGTWEYDPDTGALTRLNNRFYSALTALDGDYLYGLNDFDRIERIKLPAQ